MATGTTSLQLVSCNVWYDKEELGCVITVHSIPSAPGSTVATTSLSRTRI